MWITSLTDSYLPLGPWAPLFLPEPLNNVQSGCASIHKP